MPVVILGLVALVFAWLQSLLYQRLWDKKLSFNVRLSVGEAFEGDKVCVTEELVNNKFLPLPWVHTKTKIPQGLEALDSHGGNGLYSAGRYTSTRRMYHVLCKKRGVYGIRYSKLMAANLLHTEFFTSHTRGTGELVVFPRLLSDSGDIELLYRNLDAEVLSNRLINPDPFEFRGIRDYLPTDTLKSVNFKASAVSQKLMVNIHAPTAAIRVTLVLNIDSVKLADPELHEQSIRLVAALARRFTGQGAHLGFSTNGRDSVMASHIKLGTGTGEEHLYNIYECLARISLSLSCASMTDYIDSITDTEQLYVFISPCTGITPAFEGLRRRGVTAYMIVPSFGAENPVPGQYILGWDATPHAPGQEVPHAV